MEKENRLNLYYEYIQQYTVAFNTMTKSDNYLDMFYPIAFLFSQFMELWIKFSILNYDGFLENYTIKGLDIKGHNFLSLLDQEETKNEFEDLGVPSDAINDIISKIKKLLDLCGTSELSYAFRYPDDGTTRVYMNKLSKRRKVEAIEMMDEIMHDSYAIFCKIHDGIIKGLIEEQKIHNELINHIKKEPKLSI